MSFKEKKCMAKLKMPRPTASHTSDYNATDNFVWDDFVQ